MKSQLFTSQRFLWRQPAISTDLVARFNRSQQLARPLGKQQNGSMVIAGRVQNGVVILDPGISLPEGTEVTVSLREQKSGTPEATPEVNRSRQQAALARIDAIANENPGDPFSGADHDRILYGEAE